MPENFLRDRLVPPKAIGAHDRHGRGVICGDQRNRFDRQHEIRCQDRRKHGWWQVCGVATQVTIIGAYGHAQFGQRPTPLAGRILSNKRYVDRHRLVCGPRQHLLQERFIGLEFGRNGPDSKHPVEPGNRVEHGTLGGYANANVRSRGALNPRADRRDRTLSACRSVPGRMRSTAKVKLRPMPLPD